MSQESVFLNFDLLVQKDGADYIARVTDSPTGEAWTCFPPPLEAFEAQNLRLLMVRSRATVRSVDARSADMARDIGERLFKAAFKEDVQAAYLSSLRIAEQQDKKLRIRLRLTEPESAQLPWEYLRDPSSGGKYLALDDDTPIVRYLEINQPPRRPHVDGPMRILAVIAAPTDREGLDAEREWSNLQQALGRLIQQGAVTVQRLQPATFAALERELMQQDYHVFHFVGHGGFDPGTKEGVLVFTNDDGSSSLITSDQLGAILGDERTLQLAVLNACEGAVSEGKDIFAGSAQRLVGSGIPAVVAMQAEITDAAAISFSERFYEALALGKDVDDALVRGRKAIYTLPNPLEWGTPVLYMRGDGSLFEVNVPKTMPSAASAPPAPAPAQPVAPTSPGASTPAAAAPQAAPAAPAAPAVAPVSAAPAQPLASAAVATAAGPGTPGTAAATVAMPVPAVPPALLGRLAARWKWLLGGAVAMFLLLAVVGFVMDRMAQEAPLTPAGAATAAIDEFHQNLAKQDYYDAWIMLTDEWRGRLTYKDFSASYDGVTDTWFDVRDAIEIDATHVRLNGKITEVLKDANGKEVHVEYGGSYYLTLISGRWYLNDADFIETKRT